MLASASGHVTYGFVGTGVPDGLVHHDRDVRIPIFCCVRITFICIVLLQSNVYVYKLHIQVQLYP